MRERKQARAATGWRGALLACASWLGVACGAESEADSGGSGGSGDAPGEQVTYCEVQPILAEKCLRCHDSGASHGTSVQLNSYQNAHSRLEDIGFMVERGYMPDRTQDLEPPVAALTEQEQALLLAWVESRGSSGGCE